MRLRLISLILLLATALAASTVDPAVSAPKVPHVGQRYTVGSHTCFNKPVPAHGTYKTAYRCVEEFVRSVRATPANALIRISTYSFDIPRLTNALIAAKGRGVHVQINLWNLRANGPEPARLRRALGTNRNASSYFYACVGSCRLSGKDGISHGKDNTISNIVGAKGQTIRWLVFAGSMNWSKTNAVASFNQDTVFVGNWTLYKFSTNYANTNRLDVTQYDYPSVTANGYSIYFYPHRSKKYDVVLSALNATTCRAPRGTGYSGRTAVRMVQYNITTSRMKIIDRLVRLKKSGCDVAVMVTAINVSASIKTKLLRAGIPVYDGYVDTNHNGFKDLYQHGKDLIISGNVYGSAHTYVFAGSANLTESAITKNTELIIKYTTLKATNQYLSWFHSMKPFTHRLVSSKLDAKTEVEDESGMDMGEVTDK